MATAPSPNDLTRQQLDELDALLQRMLSVPLAPPDTPMPAASLRGAAADAPPLPPTWRVDPPAPTAGASVPHLALAEPPSGVSLKFEPPAPPPAPPAAPKTPPKATPAPAPAPISAPAPAAKAAPSPAPAPKPVAPAPKPVAAAPAPVAPVPSAPPVALPLLPLVALNATFDAACGMFGPLGRLLRSGFFKQLYGLTGLGLIAYTLAHVAQVQGWITLPVTLPWPR